MTARRFAPQALAVAAALVSAAASPARAHHDSAPGPSAEAVGWSPVETTRPARFRLGLTTSYTSTTDREYASLASRVEVSPIPRLRVALVVPVHDARRRGHDSETGVGDMDLQLAGRLWEDDAARLYAGLSFRLPSGDQTLGLGGGVYRLSPHVAGEWISDAWRARLMIGDSFALSEAEHVHGDVEPQSPHEIFYEATAGISPGPVWAGLVVGGATVLAEDGAGDTPLWLGPRMVWIPRSFAGLSLGVLAPLTEPRRFDVRVEVGSQIAFE